MAECEDNSRLTLNTVADSCCGGAAPQIPYVSHEGWCDGTVKTSIGEIPRMSTKITRADRLEHWKVRWGIGRMGYAVAPGLYAFGNPNPDSRVFVTANFKMSVDSLRSALDGLDGWVLVLDTRGINVWCAAGKGTFGTKELIQRIFITRLSQLVTHRKLIVPQLGAPGVVAHEVKQQTGFTVRYGPVRAADIPTYLDSHLKATPEMRRVQFPVKNRLALVPVDLIQWGRWGLLASVVLGLVCGFGSGIFSIERALWQTLRAAVPILGGLSAGALFTSWFLPWLPGRAFAIKGAWAGVIYLLFLGILFLTFPNIKVGWVDWASSVLLVTSAASFVGMNFTGSSTYTSLSGVKKEMRVAVPVQAAVALIGLGFWVAGRFV